MRIKRSISVFLAHRADGMFHLAKEGGWALAIFTVPMMVLLALFVFWPWTKITGTAYRDHMTRALGRLRVWRTIRERYDNRNLDKFFAEMQP
jgi:hypothetical protein